jgi:hypothetical protein
MGHAVHTHHLLKVSLNDGAQCAFASKQIHELKKLTVVPADQEIIRLL